MRTAHDRALDSKYKRRARKIPEQKLRLEAREKARRAIRRGRLIRRPCECCGTTPAEAHHDDYSKPLDVRWLCQLHHRQHHIALRKSARTGASP